MVGTGGRGYGGGVAALVAMLAAAVLAAGCGGSSSGEEVSYNGTGYPNGDAANTRNAGGPIKASTVDDLDLAGARPIEAESAFGSYASSPILSKGVLYSQDLASNVQAIEASGGDVLWTKKYELPDHGPNGVVVQGGMVFGGTPTSAFALDQVVGHFHDPVEALHTGRRAHQKRWQFVGLGPRQFYEFSVTQYHYFTLATLRFSTSTITDVNVLVSVT